MRNYLRNLWPRVWAVLQTEITVALVKEHSFSIFLGLLSVYAVTIVYLLAWPYNPIRIDDLNLSKTEVAQGEELCFQFQGEKLLPVPVKVIIELVNGEAIHIMSYEANNPVGEKFKARCFDVPYNVKPNRYQLRWSGGYQVNPLRTILRTKLSEWITVTKGTWLQGIQGKTGKTGKQGMEGPKGDKGDKGGISLFGEGKQGVQGVPGKNCTGKNCK